ncbi:uncharacterized protein EI90DRAFT_3153653 [Cantharellus anzutake]|uniref:uncharacterized protein n=1 Tax=Cantharellus anzutake TaxID=1750568 RepID=UPI00190320EE|nr:uncharacterized protein EI90DRAFT_3153653 [Cantharellus anzutake]KAF8333437.1 hypothetical protein EI90DRAFT_3153653 [Cantharellus anzutake]
MSLRQKTDALRRKIDGLLAAGGDMAIPILTAIDSASASCPPLKAATGSALFILIEVQNFRENKKEWGDFGKYVVDAVADVLATIESYDTSTEEQKPWLESVIKLSDVLQQIKNEIGRILTKMEKRSAIMNVLSHLKRPRRIDGLKKVLNEALASFQLRTNLITGAQLTYIVSGQDRLSRRIENDSVLNELRYPAVAHHDPTEGCLEGTRIELIEHIMTWCHNTEDGEKRVMLLTAVAGAGKTSVAHSIAEKCTRERTLLLIFFFKAGEQSKPDRLFSGMARSLAMHDPVYRASVISALQDDPALTTAPFTVQFEKLVAEPLRLHALPSRRPMVIIIDALDECEAREFERLADIVGQGIPKLPSNIKFFVTSRQFDLVDRFLSPYSLINRLSINLTDKANVQDCAIYIRTQLRKLKIVHARFGDELEDDDKLVQEILERAGGLFIWISTVFRYMKLASGAPTRMLKKLLDTGANRLKASAEEMMDALYTSILEKCNWKDEDFVHDYPIVMGAILVAQQPLSVMAWDAILSPLLDSSIHCTLAELAPLLSGVEAGETQTPIRILHQSLRDFVMDRIDPQSPTLCRFLVDSKRENARVALRCIEILNMDLSSTEGLGLVRDSFGRAELLPIPSDTLPEQLRYACRHIVYHLNQVQDPLEMLNELVRTFLNQQISRWVEVCVRMGGYISISALPEWAKVNVNLSSKETIQSLVKVLDNMRGNVAFLSRFQEAYELAKDSVALYRCLVSADPEVYTPDLAESLGDLGVSLNSLRWYSETLPVMEESVNLWRQLVAACPKSHTPGLARSLHRHGASLENLGRHSEALTVIEGSVKLWRELITVDPTSYLPDLAKSLGDLKISLGNLGQHSDSLLVGEECVKLWRKLVPIHPTLYTPDLAQSLQSLSISFNYLARHSDSLPVIEECVKLWRELVAVHPTSYTPDLTRSLHNHNASLVNLGWHSESLVVIEESVKLWRELVAVHPTSYTPDLARSLRNLKVSLDKLGRHSDALAAIEESVDLWRELAAVHPTSYIANLARSLGNLSWSLDKLGRHSDALPVIEESVKLWRKLVSVHPTLHTPGLARSLRNLKLSLDNLGRHLQALLVIQETVKLWREQASVHPTSYTHNLARSLGDFLWFLDKLGQHSEALPVIEESVKLWRELVAIHPTSYTPDLARSLHYLKVSLENLGRHSEALAVIEESVKLWCELVADHPTSYTQDLARSLHDLSCSFYNLGQHAEAVSFIEESILLWHSLLVTHPTSYTSDLAMALQSASITFSSLGRYGDALDMGESYYRQLHSEYPEAYVHKL